MSNTWVRLVSSPPPATSCFLAQSGFRASGVAQNLVPSTAPWAPEHQRGRDAMVFPLYDGGNQGVRRRQLHDMMRHPGYDSMLAARGEGLPGDR